MRVTRQMVPVLVTVLLVLGGPVFAGAQTCPSLTGSEDFGLGNQGVAGMVISGHYAFTADVYGLSVYDLSDLASPQRVAQLLLADEGTDIVLSGNTAFVGDFYGTLDVVDVSDPLHPSLVASVELPGSADRVALGNGLVYVSYYEPQYMGSGREGLQIVDVSDPGHPMLRGRLGAPETLLGLSKLVPGPPGVIYVGNWINGQIQTIDVSDPDHPAVADSKVNGAALARVGDVLYAVDWNDLSVVDVSDPLDPQLIRQVDANGLTGAVVQGSFLLCAGTSFRIFDLADPTDPVLISSLSSLDGGQVAGGDGVALVTDSDRSLHIVDTADPTQPSETASLALSGGANQVVAAGQWLYVANGSELRIVDVADPEQPVLRGDLATPYWIYQLGVTGSLVVFIGRARGPRVVDVSDPDAPRLVGTYTPSGQPWGLAVSGSRAYLALRTNGIDVVDLSDPAHPKRLANIDWYADSVWSSGSTLYAENSTDASGCMALKAFDVTDPADIVPVASTFTCGGEDLWDLAPTEGSLVAAKSAEGIQLLDPQTLQVLGSLETPGYAVSVEATNNMAVVGSWNGGVAFVDIGDPEHPELVAFTPTRRLTRDATVASASSTVWTAGDAIVEAVRADCVSCAGLAVSVSHGTILTGGATAMVTVVVTDLAGLAAPGQAVTGWASDGHLSDFIDRHDGSYTAVFSSGSQSGPVQLGVSVNGTGCSQGATIDVEAAPCRDCLPARRARTRARPTPR